MLSATLSSLLSFNLQHLQQGLHVITITISIKIKKLKLRLRVFAQTCISNIEYDPQSAYSLREDLVVRIRPKSVAHAHTWLWQS